MEDQEKIEIRKIVPVVARISAGKSKLLNTIYNINFLECKAGISTKFINLLRYNPNISQPRFFHLNIKKIGEKYLFYKDNNYKIVEGEENIISENKKINKTYSGIHDFKFEDIFYMTEIKDSPFIKDKDYLLTHDLCDVPGLSEAQKKEENNNDEHSQNDEIKNADSAEEDININKERQKIDDKKEDDIYYHLEDEKNTYLSEVFNIIKDYIDGGIIILSVENYYFQNNYELISKFHKVIDKTITNFLIILNKIDLCLDDINQVIENCKGRILKYFPSCKTFNLNLNTFISLSTFRLKDELLLKDDFKHLMKYHFSNYALRIKKIKRDKDYSKFISFIDYLKEIIKLEIKIEKNDINQLNISISQKNYIKNVIDEIKNDYQSEGIEMRINYGLNNNINNINDHNINTFMINDDDIINYLYINHKEGKLIPLPSEETYNLMNYFREKKEETQIEIKPKKDSFNEDEGIISKKIIIKNISDIISKLKDKEYNLLKKETSEQINIDFSRLSDLKTENNIYIPFLGPKNVGKTTILNCIIGENIFPENKPTKKIFIIQVADEDEEINMRKVKLIKKQNIIGKSYYKFDFNDDYIIAKGFKNVKETIKGLNCDLTDQFSDKYLENPENYFYLIRTKMKLFDGLNELNENIKQKIYLIDFPGFEDKNQLQNFIGTNILSIFDSFVFVLRDSLIDDSSCREFLWGIFNQAMENKGKIVEGFIKNCLFVLNLDDNKKNLGNISLKSYKDNIKTIINAPKEKNIDINVFTLKAKSLSRDFNLHNYYFNIKDTINSSFKSYCKINSSVFKNPEIYNKWDAIKKINIYSKKYGSYPKFIANKIYDELKEIFKNELSTKNLKIDSNIKNIINESIKDLEMPHYNIKIEFPESYKKNLYNYFSFAQSRLSYHLILEKYNYDIFQKNILKLIKIANNEIYYKFKINSDNINKKLSFMFNTDLKKRVGDDFEEFKITTDDLIKKIYDFLDNQINEIKLKKSECLNKINKILKSKKDGIINNIIKGKSLKIKNDILLEITNELNILNNYINNLFNNVENEGNSFFLEIKKKLLKFLGSNSDIEIEDIQNFKNHFFSIILNTNNTNNEQSIIGKISNEIQIYFNNSISKIFDEKGFFECLKSIFSRDSFFSNFIEIINKYLSDRINYILNLLSENLNTFIRDKIDLINYRKGILSINYTDNEINKIEELKKEWNNILEVNTHNLRVYFKLYLIQPKSN